MSIEWVKFNSWHAVRLTRSLRARTMCGRVAKIGAETSSTLPADKSCESCLRIVARRADG